MAPNSLRRTGTRCGQPDGSLSLNEARIAATLNVLVAAAAKNAEWRLVGTAASVVRGADVTVNDIDILLRERSAVDEWVTDLSKQHTVEQVPMWLSDARQYFARVAIDDTMVEFSTVELPAETDALECVGRGPWIHFDVVEWHGLRIPVVASELRLVTEAARGRPAQIQSIIQQLRADGCDTTLVARGLTNAGVPGGAVEQIIHALRD